MSNRQDKKGEQPHNRPLTAHELIQRHVEHPEEPITDEDIENIRVGEEEANRATEAAFNTATVNAEQTQKAGNLANE